MRVVVYDDNIEFLDFMKNLLDKINKKRGNIFGTPVYFSEKNEVIEYVEKNKEYLTVFLLDIMADDVTVGYEITNYIKSIEPRNPVVYISDCVEKYIYNVSQKIISFTFIAKDSEEIYDELEEALLTAYSHLAQKVFISEDKKHLISIMYEDILYFEKIKGTHYTKVVHKNGESPIKDTLKAIKSKLDGKGVFIYPTKEFLVNVNKITEIDKRNRTLLIANGDCIPFSPERITELKNACWNCYK